MYFVRLWCLNLKSRVKIYSDSCYCCSCKDNIASPSVPNNLIKNYDLVVQEPSPLQSPSLVDGNDNFYIVLEDYPSPTTRYASLSKGQRVIVNRLYNELALNAIGILKF